MTDALIVIDVQEEYFSGLLPIEFPPRAESLAHIGRAMDAATAAGTPVVVVRHNHGPLDMFRPGSPTWALRPEVGDRPFDLLVDKVLPGAFTGTDLQPWLIANGVDRLTIAGYMTNVCCDTTARQAIHEGWGARVLHDATGVPAMNGPDGVSIPARTLQPAALAPLALIGVDVTTVDAWLVDLAAG